MYIAPVSATCLHLSYLLKYKQGYPMNQWKGTESPCSSTPHMVAFQDPCIVKYSTYNINMVMLLILVLICC